MGSKDFLILYGSHTGQAEAIAGNIKERSEKLGWRPRLHVLNDNEKTFDIEKETLAVIVVSSTGDGDAPENCARFMRRIHKQTLPSDYLKTLEYALLGLGDSNYSTFQGIPRKLDKRLQGLGARKLLTTGEADDQVGLELAVEPWIESLFKVLAEKLPVDPNILSSIFSSKVMLNPVKSKEEKDEIAQQQVSEWNEEEEEEKKISNKMLNAHPYEYPDVSIRSGDEKLKNDAALRVPIAPEPFLCSSVSHKNFDDTSLEGWQNSHPMVGVVSKPYAVTVVGTALVTDVTAKKPKREIILDLGEHESDLPYEPGDAIYFIVPNPEHEVNYIIERCGLTAVADQELKISVDSSTKKIKATIPGYIPAVCSVRHALTSCLDIRRAPGRPLLRMFADNASVDSEKRRLLELCSAQGLNDFTQFIRQAGLSIADVLMAFPSVKPSLDRLLELLPRLIPRPYSVASDRGKRVRFIYSILDFPVEQGRRYPRKGLATEWLINLRVGDKIQVLAKEPARFRLPPPPMSPSIAASMPLLMIGPGTGVAVFLAFCQHLLKVKLADPENFPRVPRILYFGCRDFSKDYIYRDELESYVREGILDELIACESEGNGTTHHYVQDALKGQKDKVADFLKLENEVESRIFICGDAKGMSKDVWQTFHEIVESTMSLSTAETKQYMLDLKKSDRYVEDVWS